MNEFSSLPLQPELLQAVAALGFEAMTPIQAASLPPMLEGRDVIAQAKTGSGKTAAFGLALLSRIDASLVRTQALVLCPTRELADQVSKDIRRLASTVPNIKLLTLCGGIPLRPQLASLQHPPHIVVGTPGRIQELLQADATHGSALDLSSLTVLVLDEADRMLDMGFEPAIREIVKMMPRQRQTLLFSATWPDAMRAISKRIQRDPVEVTVDAQTDAIAQRFFEIAETRRIDALVAVLLEQSVESALVFCNTRKDVAEVAEALVKRGFSALALHGELDQREREEVLVRFANRSCSVLVATDVAARGLDIKELPLVISYELPTDADAHVHRIGRTGRAGEAGLALHLVAPREIPRANLIETALGQPLRWQGLTFTSTNSPPEPMWSTVVIDAGRQDKLRPGDILGALTGDAGLEREAVGKIDIFATRSYVAIGQAQAAPAMQCLQAKGIKGRKFRLRALR
ncbi:MAG: ATP-dependent RNA helicase DbpA [Lysobacteraceae bacterium]